MNDLAFGSGSYRILCSARALNNEMADILLRETGQKPIPNLAKQYQRREKHFLFHMPLTGVPFNAVENLVRQTYLKLPLYPWKPCDLSVMHPLKVAPDESNAINVWNGGENLP